MIHLDTEHSFNEFTILKDGKDNKKHMRAFAFWIQQSYTSSNQAHEHALDDKKYIRVPWKGLLEELIILVLSAVIQQQFCK